MLRCVMKPQRIVLFARWLVSTCAEEHTLSACTFSRTFSSRAPFSLSPSLCFSPSLSPFHAIRSMLGDDVFWGAIRDYVSSNLFKLVETGGQ